MAKIEAEEIDKPKSESNKLIDLFESNRFRKFERYGATIYEAIANPKTTF